MNNLSSPLSTIITITRPDDWHLHLRDGTQLATVLPHSSRTFARALIMPNLKPPLTDLTLITAYRERIKAACPKGSDFTPFMTLYLTDDLKPATVQKAAASDYIKAVKLYPMGVTTNSAAGVTNVEKIYPIFALLEELDLPLSVHAEISDVDVDIFDREKIFIDQYLHKIIATFPKLRIILEHITTTEAVQFVIAAPMNVAATITAHHLLYNRNALFAVGINPHFYCLPVLKREHHRQSLVAAATSGNPKFFLGTDSAPHAFTSKENACGCAGIFSAHAALELYTEVFAQAHALERLEGFTSWYGADFYRIPRNKGCISLINKPWLVPSSYAFGDTSLVPLRAGATVAWQVLTS